MTVIGLKRCQHPNRGMLGRHTLIYSMVIIVLMACLELICVSGHGHPKGDEICETLPSEIHLIKGILLYVCMCQLVCLVWAYISSIIDKFFHFPEEYDELGRLQRTCNDEVQVNKCEGLCNSQVQPSVITPTGFLKECYCCRESFLHERVVTLSHCYDPDGTRLTTPEMATMDIRLKEPAECKCYKCGDFSR